MVINNKENKNQTSETEPTEALQELRNNVGRGKRAPRIFKSIFGPREYSVLKAKAIVRGLILLLAVVLISEFFLIADTVLPDARYGKDGPPVTTYAVPEIKAPKPSINDNQQTSIKVTQVVDRDVLFDDPKPVEPYTAPPEPDFNGEVEFPPVN